MSRSVQLDLVSGGQAKLRLEEPDRFPSSYFISSDPPVGLQFWQVLIKILEASQRSVCWFSRDLREQGLKHEDIADASIRSLLLTSGYTFGIFWTIDRILQELDEAGNRTFMLVRDPRDVIVNTYLAAMETGKKASTDQRSEAPGSDRDASRPSIIDFVRSSEADRIVLRYRRFADFCRSAKNVTVFRYEDVMFTWRTAVTNLMEKLNLEISQESAFAIADSSAVVANVSKVNGNGPQDSPAAFRKHMDRAAIAAVEERFADPMAYFGYAPEETLPAAFLNHQAEFLHAVSARFSAARAQCCDLAAQIRGPVRGMPDTPKGVGARSHSFASGRGGCLNESDPALQWRLKPNASLEIKVLGRNVVMDADVFGCRPVVGQPNAGEKTLSVYGCSVTFGWAIPVEETFCSLLQSMLPTWRVENHGVDGYSGAQNLIQLQRVSRWSAAEYVTFCWIEHHMLRNVADPTWLRMIARARRGAFPRASLDRDGKLQYRSVMLPRSDLGGVDWTELSPDPHYLDLICFALFRRAAEIVRENGGHFFVTTLLGQMSWQLKRRLNEFGIPLVDASVRGDEYTCLPDDPHPNAHANRFFAEKIREYLIQREAN
jgi:hypothetical protein